MRTRLASLIVVKQEPLTNEYLDESEQNALIVGQTNYNEVDTQYFGLIDRHRDILPTSIQSIGDLNNNNSNYVQPDEFIEDKKCTYRFSLLSLSHCYIVANFGLGFGQKKNHQYTHTHSFRILIFLSNTLIHPLTQLAFLSALLTHLLDILNQHTHSFREEVKKKIVYIFIVFVYYKFLLTFRFW